MPQLPTTIRLQKEGIRVTIYKSVIPNSLTLRKRDFLLWGASSYLYTDTFQSLSGFSLLDPVDTDYKDNKISLTENRYIYLYKDHETNLFPEQALDWIFNKFPDSPLLVITLVKTNLQHIIAKLQGVTSSNLFLFDIYKTLGQDTCVIVFRSGSYSPVLDCILELNAISKATYSIAGIDNRPRARGKFTPEDTSRGTRRICASINYLLKEGNASENRVKNAVRNIIALKKRAARNFKIKEEDIVIQIYYEIGRFDVEVRIEGNIEHILELLLNPRYGLSNHQSIFYRKHVFESQTTWKMAVSI